MAQRHAWSTKETQRLGLWVHACTREGCTAARRRLESTGTMVHASSLAPGRDWSTKPPACVAAAQAEQLELGAPAPGGRL